jgi:hypothetical protein
VDAKLLAQEIKVTLDDTSTCLELASALAIAVSTTAKHQIENSLWDTLCPS